MGLPSGRVVDLPGRGATWIRDIPGPPGAPVLLLLHGWTVTADLNFSGAYTILAQEWRVVALDHRGHGRGLRGPDPFRLEDCADDAVALLDALGVTRAVVAGYSMGGAVALLAAARHPARVAGLVLCATAGVFVTNGLLRRLCTGVATLAGPAARRAARLWPDATSLPSGLNPRSWPAVLDAGLEISRFRAQSWLADLGKPAAVVLTLNDRMVPPYRQQALAEATGASVHPLPGGHDACRSAQFATVLLEAARSVQRDVLRSRGLIAA
jgi:3-oxoadipate enol-lactonase